jgi:DNA-binding CsgD family transcriptional regulator
VRLTWPLTGRSKEVRLIEAHLSDRDSSGIVICGAAGVGKSRLAREAVDIAASQGFEVRWVIGTSSARTIPLGALASWAEPGDRGSLEVVREAINVLSSATAGKTPFVGVDDVPMLDDLSTFVLHQLIQRRAAKVLLTVRDGEPIPRATQELWLDGQFERLDLQPLSRDETTALVSATLGGPVDPEAADNLWRLTRGNVLYLRNIVEQEVADGRLMQQRGFWRWTGDPTMPPGLVELIESRIGALPTAISDVVDTLAVGEPIELTSLSRITGAAAVEEADLHGLITLEPGDDGVEVRVAHPLYGEVRRRRAPTTRLRRLRAIVATELAGSKRSEDTRVVVRRATLSLDSDLAPDPDLLVKAARGAVWLADLPLADRLADAAIREGAGADAKFIRAEVLSWLGRGNEADAVLASLDRIRLQDDDHGKLVFYRAINMLFSLGDSVGAKKFIDQAAHTTRTPAHGYIDAFLTVYWAAMGNSVAASESSKGFVWDELSDAVCAGAAWAIASAFGDAGRAGDAIDGAEAGYMAATRSFDVAYMQFVIADAHLSALLLSGRVEEACAVAEQLRRHATDLPGDAQTYSICQAGRAALGAGRLNLACSLLEPVVDRLIAGGDTNGWEYRYRLPYTIALAMRGLTDEAAAALATLKRCQHPCRRYLHYEYALAQAWVAACQGAMTRATGILLTAAETAVANGQLAAEVMCLQTVAQFGNCTGAHRLRDLVASVEGPRVGLAARYADALRDGDAVELAAVSEAFEDMGDGVAAVDAASHAALEYRRHGMRGSALGCSARAQSLADRCGGIRTPTLLQAAEPLPVTNREREIISLLSRGLSTKDVATHLTLSVRTVEGHIYRVMTKTGAASREDLLKMMQQPDEDQSDTG